MSRIVQTDLGRFNITSSTPLLECPCGEWLTLSDEQANGRVSVDHDSMGCPKHYHETHDYQATLRAKVTVTRLYGEDPFAGGEV